MKTYDFFAPTRVLFGEGQLSNLHTLTMPGKKALLVISNGKSTILNGSLDRTKSELQKARVEVVVFNKIAANPLKAVVEEGAKVGRENSVDLQKACGVNHLKMSDYGIKEADTRRPLF